MDVINWHPEVSTRVTITCHCATKQGSYAYPVQDGFKVESTSGQIYDDVDLSDGEWVDYDEKLGESVGIMELEHKFVTHKG